MELVYVGSAGDQGGTLRSRLSDHLNRKGWQTSFRRKVLSHVLGISERPRLDQTYKSQLKQSTPQITQEIVHSFAFKCIMTQDYHDFEIWLIHKYQAQLWNTQKYQRKVINNDFSKLEESLLATKIIPFSHFEQTAAMIPDFVGVYIIFQMRFIDAIK
jgi:hypothetical protein